MIESFDWFSICMYVCIVAIKYSIRSFIKLASRLKLCAFNLFQKILQSFWKNEKKEILSLVY